jgi:hypothetical protein
MSAIRFRGAGEGMFGGMNTRREPKPGLALKRGLLEAICCDLRILPTLAVWPGRPIRCLILAL